ncbi:hypothetical protein Ocin01_07293 [Orchesella cincta]|uniref:Uncharacterized protein n=1 Tax=Orchesella cincta TaxID=48709 RepID=A0A1D2N274_ORCCI|nr:hypothetical protein Ocin01_07293 [Orchesella cincta]
MEANMSLHLFPKVVFLVVLMTYLKATEEFKATHHSVTKSDEASHDGYISRMKERFRRNSQVC